MSADDLKRKIQAASDAGALFHAELLALRSHRRILCACGKLHAIRNLDLIVTHWYTDPHGCTEGDYWNEGNWHFVGPCGQRNRLYFNDSDRPWNDHGTTGAEYAFKATYGRRIWKSVTEEHEHNRPSAPNNSYVDQHRKRFELPLKVKK